MWNVTQSRRGTVVTTWAVAVDRRVGGYNHVPESTAIDARDVLSIRSQLYEPLQLIESAANVYFDANRLLAVCVPSPMLQPRSTSCPMNRAPLIRRYPHVFSDNVDLLAPIITRHCSSSPWRLAGFQQSASRHTSHQVWRKQVWRRSTTTKSFLIAGEQKSWTKTLQLSTPLSTAVRIHSTIVSPIPDVLHPASILPLSLMLSMCPCMIEVQDSILS